MAFSLKKWFNKAESKTTPLNAASLNDLEKRVTDYSDLKGVSVTTGWESVLNAGAIPAIVVSDAEIGSSSTAIKSPGGHFTSIMNGQSFYLQNGGPVLVTGTNVWKAHPLIGTFTYVSATEGTLSVATTTAVNAGEIIIGPDCTSAINTAIALGYGFVPANTSLIIAGEITLGTSKSLIGSGLTSRLFSVTKKANVLTSAWTTGPRIEDLSIYGNGWGEQPSNVDPGEGVTPNWIKSGSGIIFAAVTRGRISNVRTYFCGGNATTSERDGVAGVWTTMGCKECDVIDVHATYCRNGINEDNFFASVEHEYAPLNNTYTRPIVNYNYIGIGSDSGSQSRGLVIDNPVGNRCVISGVEIHRTNFATVIAPRCEFNGLVTGAPGLYIHGNESANAEYQQITVLSPQCHFNGSHGIKVSEFVTNWKIVGGVSSRNQFHGLYANNKAHKGRVIGLTTRDNGAGGEFDGVHITKCTDVWLLVASYDDQGGPTQKWGVKADEESESIIVAEGSTFSGNIKGSVSLVGANSRKVEAALLNSTAQTFVGRLGIVDTPSVRIPNNFHGILVGSEAVAGGGETNTIANNLTATFKGDFTGITGANAGTMFGLSVFATIGTEAEDGKGVKVLQGTSLAGVIKGTAPTGLEVLRGNEMEASFYGASAGGEVGQAETLRVVGPRRTGGATAGKVTGTAYSLFVTEPTIEAATKFSLFVEGGVSRFGGTVQLNNTLNNAAGSGSLSIFGATSKATGAAFILRNNSGGGQAIIELEKANASFQITNGTSAVTVFDNEGHLRLSNINSATSLAEPKTPSKKLPIYNVSGEFQGYVPLYASIT